MLYMSDECPGCHERVKKFVRRQRDPKPKWHEFTVYDAHCPHCDARVEVDEKSTIWLLLGLPWLVIWVWEIALARSGGVPPWLYWGSVVLGLVGLAITYVKRRLVAVEPRSVEPDPGSDRKNGH